MREGKPELLAPAGSYEGVLAAAAAGADAVYVGGARYGARAFARNLSEEELLSAIDYLHVRGKKLYLTVNTLLKDGEFDELPGYLAPFYDRGLDAVIVQDLGVMAMVAREFPGLAIHASTQMTVTGPLGLSFLKRYPVKRAVLARELSLEEIAEVCRATDLEIECFVHGALCYCYSGQCLMSSMLGGRSGNRGRCAQPCRLPYTAAEDGRAMGRKKSIYPLSPRDICTLQYLPELLEAGVTSLKIEGRMKRAEYTAGVVSIYRKYLDLWEMQCTAGGETKGSQRPGGGRRDYQVNAADMEFLERLYTRSGFSGGYLKQHNGPQMMALGKPDYSGAEEAFYEDIRKRYLESSEQFKENLRGNVSLKKGLPARMELASDTDGISVCVCGGVVQEARKQPLTQEKVRAQLTKTGGTPFLVEPLELSMDPDVFLPVQELNALRREAIQSFEEARLAPCRRTKSGEQATEGWVDRDVRTGTWMTESVWPPSLSVSVETEDQLAEVLACPEVTDVYVSSRLVSAEPTASRLTELAEACHRAGKRCFFQMPLILRTDTVRRYEGLSVQLTEGGFDGAVAGTVDALEFLKETGCPGELRADASLYTMNREARRVLKELADRDTAPLELNFKELRRRGCMESELYVYGYLPLMVTAQCVEKNLGTCSRKPGYAYLTDRYQKQFAVYRDCDSCSNIIYNSTPLVLLGCEEKVARLKPRSIRMSFTFEERRETRRVLDAYVRGFYRGEDMAGTFTEFTRGHFNRGVE